MEVTRFVLRNGDVFESSRDPEMFDTYCYQKDGVERTCLLLSDQTEVDFLMVMGVDMQLKYDCIELG